MINGYLVVREEKHVDPKFWVCHNRTDALAIAKQVTKFWKNEYELTLTEVDEERRRGLLYNYDKEDCFRVYVILQDIREAGEIYDVRSLESA